MYAILDETASIFCRSALTAVCHKAIEPTASHFKKKPRPIPAEGKTEWYTHGSIHLLKLCADGLQLPLFIDDLSMSQANIFFEAWPYGKRPFGH